MRADRDLHPLGSIVILSLVAAVLVLFQAGATNAQGLRVYPNAESVRPLAVGSRIPNPTVRNLAGERVDLEKRIGDRGALLVFYRGGW